MKKHLLGFVIAALVVAWGSLTAAAANCTLECPYSGPNFCALTIPAGCPYVTLNCNPYSRRIVRFAGETDFYLVAQPDPDEPAVNICSVRDRYSGVPYSYHPNLTVNPTGVMPQSIQLPLNALVHVHLFGETYIFDLH